MKTRTQKKWCRIENIDRKSTNTIIAPAKKITKNGKRLAAYKNIENFNGLALTVCL